jgi:diguanylate cyclase (GGDEF)-like protein
VTALRAAASRAGLGVFPRRALVLTGILFVLAVGATVAGLLVPAKLPPDDPLSPLARLGIASGVMAMAQLASLRLRIGSGRMSVTWGEAALIIGLYIAPAGWLPAATFVGAGVAWLLLSLFADLRTPIEAVHIALCQTVAVTVAVTVTCAFADPIGHKLTPGLTGALFLGALVYLLVGAFLAVLTYSLQHGTPLLRTLVRALHDKLLMFVGNVILGLVVVTMIAHDPRWLLLLPPALWLLQQTYGHRLRADDERRAWQEFANATGALNRLDERGVVSAGIGGALGLFNAEAVEIDVIRPDGGWRRYRGDASGDRSDDELGERPRGDADDAPLARPLIVGGVHVGDLRVRLTRGTAASGRDELALAAFGDALAAALHDAATHRELAILSARSSYDAVHDPLTSLLNRFALMRRGEAMLRELDHGEPVMLVLLDINRFREVNDTLGHAAGDELLQSIAARLATMAGDDELLGRLGGDEFALLARMPAGTSQTAIGDRDAAVPVALLRAREMVEGLAEPVEVEGVRMSVEASAGVVVAGAGTADLTELLRRADVALYQGKDGGSAVTGYDPGRDVASTDQLALLAELREALADDSQLVLALQPAVDLSTGAPTGVEALIRWKHPRRGTLTPGDFVRVAEGSELLGEFTRYVIDRALAVAADIASHGITVPISVNLSAQSLLDPHLPGDVQELLRRHGIPPNMLVLEITETVVMRELEVVDEVLGALREIGVQLAVDDFGTGFSSLTFLTRITVDEVKVDRSFVARMADSPHAAAIVRATIDLGRELNLRVVAEGVETSAQRAALAALGCAAAQGYHFFKPMPADKIVAVLAQLLDKAQAQVFPFRADGTGAS